MLDVGRKTNHINPSISHQPRLSSNVLRPSLLNNPSIRLIKNNLAAQIFKSERHFQ